uniref:Calpain catalytic domain-containing protein n=1 Tax=Elaeophora elaphi TaxID=1147741 RepID=A0A0R3RR61_9BILA
MFEDNSQKDNINEWYRKVQMCRRIPPRRLPTDECDKPKCYALSLRNAQLPGLKMDLSYRIHAYFYDKQRKYYFGKPFCGGWHRSGSDSIPFTEVIFFWCSFTDNIDIILEIVEGEQREQNSNHLYTAAWTSLSLENAGNTTAFRTYRKYFARFTYKPHPLYPGSPKALFFMVAEFDMTDLFRRTNIGVELCLQTYEEMYSVLDYIPNWYIFDQWEDIPGLRTSYDGEIQATHPEALKSGTSILSKINVSFGMDVCKFEQILLHLLNNDRLYRANKSPANINIEMMEVLERRITIGMHNGLCYVERPQCLRLSSSENQICSISEMKRSQSQNLFVNGSIILNRMITDPHFAIVFSLDYLVGVYSYDGTVHSSQSVMVCWGAWCPFAMDCIPNGEITIPVIGGPTINPDERLAFKNSLNFRSNLPFCDQIPRIKITFICSGIGQIEQLLNISTHVSNESQIQNWKKPIMKTVGRQLSSAAKTAQNFTKILGNRYTQQLQNVLTTMVPYVCGTVLTKLYILQEEEKFDGKITSGGERKYETYMSTKIYSSPLVRTSNISRASLAILADISFPPIKDRNGNKPKFQDIENFPTPNINVELNDKLNTNEIIVQFMAIQISYIKFCKYLSKTDDDWIEIPNTIFFTMEFYRFHTVTTERLWLNTVHAKTSGHEQLFILKRKGNSEESVKEDCNGFSVRYMVDGNSLLDGDEEDYINYLSNGYAIVDVWDADSLLPLGKSYIPLKPLLRHGSEAVQTDVQSAVVLSSFPESSIVTCQILLRLASIGYPCFKQMDSIRNRTSAVVSRQLARIGQSENESYKIRAKPLNPIHENSLQRFLTAQRLDINQRYNEIMNGTPLETKTQNSVTKPLTTKGSMKRYLFQQELEAYKKLRDEDKASKLLKVVFKAITTEYRPLFDVGLWQYYKNMYGIETPLEQDLYQISKENEQISEVHIFLKPMETICAPFIYDGFTLPQEQIKNQVKIIFKKKSDGEPIAILDLLVGNRRNIISNSFRFYHEAETTLSRIIHIAGYKSRVFSIRCTDPLVLTSFKNNNDGSQDLHFTCQTGKAPMLRTFTVIFFADQYYGSVLGAWLIHIHAVDRINLNAVQAQLIKVPIILKIDDNCDGLVHFGNCSKNFEIHPSDVIAAQRGDTLNATVNFLPNFTGSRMMLISATNQRTNHLLYQWMIAVNVQEANITKMFETLAVRNRYSVERTFRISCSHPEYIQIENDVIMLSGYKTIDVSVTFLLKNGPNLPEVLIFVTNVENNLQEEAYSLKLIYHD